MLSRLRYQEAQLGVGFAWILAPFGFTLAGFYFGTIWYSSTVQDLQLPDVLFGFKTGALGLLVGVAVAIFVTVAYPPFIDREYKQLEAESHHH